MSKDVVFVMEKILLMILSLKLWFYRFTQLYSNHVTPLKQKSAFKHNSWPDLATVFVAKIQKHINLMKGMLCIQNVS